MAKTRHKLIDALTNGGVVDGRGWKGQGWSGSSGCAHGCCFLSCHVCSLLLAKVTSKNLQLKIRIRN